MYSATLTQADLLSTADSADSTLSVNTLYYGDNLDNLRKLRDETIDLCYIDPPFNSKRTYNQIYNNIGGEDRAQAQAFTDTWVWDDQADEGFQKLLGNEKGRYAPQTVALIKGLHGVLKEGSLLAYLVSMTRRIVEIHRVLKATGSFYLHCDPTSSHYLKLVLDGIFCTADGDFRNELIWRRTPFAGSSKARALQFPRSHDVLLFYTKGTDWTWNRPTIPYSEKYLRRFKWDDNDNRGPYRKTLLKTFSDATFERLKADNRLIAPIREGAKWSYKQYLSKSSGETQIDDVWTDVNAINPVAKERLGYPTQKPEALLERIISASSNKGDVILDAYCGCGTTVAVAQRLERNWIGMDVTYQAIALILKRLEDAFGKDVAGAVRLSGVPRDMESAEALAHKKDDRTRKEFEKWAVLTYTQNRGVINDKKGADAGIDGAAYFLTSKTDNDKMVFQVKSGHVGRGDIARLKGDMQREKAALAMFLTLEESSAPMRAEAKSAGFYTHALTGRRIDQIQIVTIREMLEKGRRMDLPLTLEVLNAAERKQPGTEQTSFDLKPARPKVG